MGKTTPPDRCPINSLSLVFVPRAATAASLPTDAVAGLFADATVGVDAKASRPLSKPHSQSRKRLSARHSKKAVH